MTAFKFLGKLFLQQIMRLNANIATLVEKVHVNEQCKISQHWQSVGGCAKIFWTCNDGREKARCWDLRCSELLLAMHVWIHDVNKYYFVCFIGSVDSGFVNTLKETPGTYPFIWAPEPLAEDLKTKWAPHKPAML